MQIVAESGREIVLYRVGPGEACVMTVSCLMGHSLYNGEGIVEEPLQGYAIGLPLFNELMATSQPISQFDFAAIIPSVFLTLSMSSKMSPSDRLESRLAARLLQLGEQENCVNCTHQFLATDLGSAREVISRLLKRWEQQGIITLLSAEKSFFC